MFFRRATTWGPTNTIAVGVIEASIKAITRFEASIVNVKRWTNLTTGTRNISTAITLLRNNECFSHEACEEYNRALEMKLELSSNPIHFGSKAWLLLVQSDPLTKYFGFSSIVGKYTVNLGDIYDIGDSIEYLMESAKADPAFLESISADVAKVREAIERLRMPSGNEKSKAV